MKGVYKDENIGISKSLPRPTNLSMIVPPTMLRRD
jgi:hypothetical protein